MLILGIDEAGRGPIIGPMVIGAALIDDGKNDEMKTLGVKDSKQVTPSKRVKLYPVIKEMAVETHTVHIPAHEIDSLRKKMSLNEIEALKIAELIVSFKKRPDLIVIDLPDPDEFMFIRRISKYAKISEKITAEHKADANFPSVSAASILAKVERDAEVEKLEKKHGSMGSGYPSDPRTIDFLNRHTGEKFDFVRYSWATAKRTISKREANQSSLDEF